MPSPWVSAALNRRALSSSFTNRASGFAVVNGSLWSVTKSLVDRHSPVREVGWLECGALWPLCSTPEPVAVSDEQCDPHRRRPKTCTIPDLTLALWFV